MIFAAPWKYPLMHFNTYIFLEMFENWQGFGFVSPFITMWALSQERLSLCFWAGKTHLSLLIYRDKLEQGSHRLEKYLNIQDCLIKSLKMKFVLKNTWKTLKGLVVLFVWFDSLRPINNLSVIKGRVFLGWTSTKLGLMFLLKDTTQWRPSGSNPRPFGLKSSTEPLRSPQRPWKVL